MIVEYNRSRNIRNLENSLGKKIASQSNKVGKFRVVFRLVIISVEPRKNLIVEVLVIW